MKIFSALLVSSLSSVAVGQLLQQILDIVGLQQQDKITGRGLQQQDKITGKSDFGNRYRLVDTVQYTEPGRQAGTVQYREPDRQAGAVQYREPGRQAGAVQYTEPGRQAGAVQYTEPGDQDTLGLYNLDENNEEEYNLYVQNPTNPADSLYEAENYLNSQQQQQQQKQYKRQLRPYRTQQTVRYEQTRKQQQQSNPISLFDNYGTATGNCVCRCTCCPCCPCENPDYEYVDTK
ncbi:repetin [Eurytemora carolleeae]|uniref:repetin n=1 Tax=Eurytemora carolleeae TaxID=1294199 RepID=UPI000C77A4DC|nr:repetin [Eurytemora carolleeae]|eukprot:XP_023324930.1 repetin-like [Eurytemora affinis]